MTQDAQLAVVAVLLPKAQILSALERLSGDVWTQVAPQRMVFFETTA